MGYKNLKKDLDQEDQGEPRRIPPGPIYPQVCRSWGVVQERGLAVTGKEPARLHKALRWRKVLRRWWQFAEGEH